MYTSSHSNQPVGVTSSTFNHHVNMNQLFASLYHCHSSINKLYPVPGLACPSATANVGDMRKDSSSDIIAIAVQITSDQRENIFLTLDASSVPHRLWDTVAFFRPPCRCCRPSEAVHRDWSGNPIETPYLSQPVPLNEDWTNGPTPTWSGQLSPTRPSPSQISQTSANVTLPL